MDEDGDREWTRMETEREVCMKGESCIFKGHRKVWDINNVISTV